MVASVRSQITRCEHCGRKNRVPVAASGAPRCAACHNPLPWIADAGDEDFDDVALKSTLPVVVDLWAPWCGPCRMVGPVLERLAAERAGRVKLVKVNVDEATAVARRYEAQSIPLLLVLVGGKVVARQVGAAPEHQLRAWLDRAVTSSSSGKAGGDR
jgi:thioredoxin 2